MTVLWFIELGLSKHRLALCKYMPTVVSVFAFSIPFPSCYVTLAIIYYLCMSIRRLCKFYAPRYLGGELDAIVCPKFGHTVSYVRCG